MTRTVARRCPSCSRVLFTTRGCLWPWHYTAKRAMSAQVWCIASGTRAPTPKGPAPRMGSVHA